MSDLSISTVDHHVGLAHSTLDGTELGGAGLVEISPAAGGEDAVDGVLLNRWITNVKFTKGRAGVDVPPTAGVPSGGQVKGTGESTYEIEVVPEADGRLTELFEALVASDEHPVLVAQFHGGGAPSQANPQTRARIVVLSIEDGGQQGAVKTHSFSGKVHGQCMTWNGTAWTAI